MQIHGKMIEISFKDSHLCLTAGSKMQWQRKETYQIQYASNTCIFFLDRNANLYNQTKFFHHFRTEFLQNFRDSLRTEKYIAKKGQTKRLMLFHLN